VNPTGGGPAGLDEDADDMGDLNQLDFVRRNAPQFHGPYLEVGSKDYGNTQDLRSLFAAQDRYIGVDLEEGPGVDVVLDLTGPLETIEERLGPVRFGTIFCLSVLEHCQQPFKMAENLTRLLRPGGVVCISAPFAWEYHSYPSDYWRFTHHGIQRLFAGLDFDLEQGVWATCRTGEFAALNRDVGMRSFGSKWNRRRGRYLRAISAKLLALLAKVGILRWVAGYPYVLVPTNIMMIGRKRE
jgi:SAM-dependent methyltransferase